MGSEAYAKTICSHLLETMTRAMLSPPASLGVATLCFYIPTALASVLLCFKLRRTPLPAVWLLLLFVCLSNLHFPKHVNYSIR